MEKKNKGRRLLFLAVGLTLAFIWGNSLLPASASGALSEKVTALLSRLFGAAFDPSSGHGTVRKLAHAAEFLLLGLELTALFRREGKRRWSWILLCGLGTCFMDETIQLFVSGRDGKIPDMWIDLGGFAAGALLLLLIGRIRKRKT